MMRIALLPVAAAVALAGCSTVTVGADYDRAIDFAAWKSWAWAEPAEPGTGPDSPDLNVRRIRAAVEKVLAERQYAQAEPAAADFFVGFHTSIERRTEIVTYGSDPYWGRRYGCRSSWWSTSSVYDYDIGTLFIDFLDRRAAVIGWRGHASAVLEPDLEPAEREARIEEAVRKMLAQFPPAPATK